MSISQTIASLDLGSNSFHLLVATIEQGSFRPIYSDGCRTQLGLSQELGVLSDSSIQRGLSCLTEFRKILDQHRVTTVLAVGTAALRNAKNAQDFILPAQTIIGCKINVISGTEEAGLIFSGVSHLMPVHDSLIIDIGGASTELVQRCSDQATKSYSLDLGCLSHLQTFYSQPQIDGDKFERSILSARAKIQQAKAFFNTRHQAVLGCSGVIDAVQSVLAENHWGEIITADGLEQARQHAIASFKHINEVRYSGLRDDRRNLYLSGLAIIIALFKELEVASIEHVSAALKEGMVAQYIEQHASA
jgi:exopolyphosphatase/guanosine-5'-triphosphate,3'-diphosphate pyrophosphatase